MEWITRPYRWDIKAVRTRRTIMKTVCEEFNVSEEELKGVRKLRQHADARASYAYLVKTLFPNTKMIEIAEDMGIDHTTVVRQIEKIEGLIFVKDRIKEVLTRIETRLKVELI